jgi:hypothetical protein
MAKAVKLALSILATGGESITSAVRPLRVATRL